MVSRRSVLGASGLGAASALAGCSGFRGESGGSGVPARFGRGASAPATSTVVAFADSTAGDASTGRLESSSAAFEREDGELVVVSYHRVVAGDPGWRYVAVGATHDWTAVSGAVAGVETNMTTGPADSPDAALRLASERGDRTRSWRVVLPEPSTQSVAFRFRTAFEPATELEAGDALTTVSGTTELTDGSFLGERETVATEHVLVHGDTPVANE
jgi:hypothetical protein